MSINGTKHNACNDAHNTPSAAASQLLYTPRRGHLQQRAGQQRQGRDQARGNFAQDESQRERRQIGLTNADHDRMTSAVNDHQRSNLGATFAGQVQQRHET